MRKVKSLYGLGKAILIAVLIALAGFALSTSITNGFWANGDKTLAKNEEKQIEATVRDFWDIAIRGDREASRSFIAPPADEFWRRCVSSIQIKQDSDGLTKHADPIAASDNIDSPPSSRYFTYPLESFWEQMLEKKPELLTAKVTRLAGNEAIVQVRWRAKGDDFSGFNDFILMQKLDGSWKVMLWKTTSFKHPAIESYATEGNCK